MIHKVAFVLLIIGGLAWGMEAAGYPLASYLPMGLMTLVYVLVALSALYELFSHKGMCKACSKM
jgi:uncharacterized membrane protein YuzA (DUF378 family)